MARSSPKAVSVGSPRRRILVTPWLLKGHSLPVLAVAKALSERGHDVLFLTEKGMEREVREAGCQPLRMPGDRRGEEILAARKLGEFKGILVRQAEQSARFIRKVVETHGIEGVLTDIFQIGTPLALEGTGVPWASVNICGPFNGDANTYRSAHATLKLGPVRSRLGLPPSKVNSYDFGHSPGLVLLPWTAEFECVERSPQSVHVGLLNWTRSRWTRPAWLRASDDGRPRVLATMTTNQGKSITDRLVRYVNDTIAALNEMDVHGFLGVAPDDPMVRTKPAPHVKLIGFVANDRVIPECDALLFHGGWGTGGYALQAGVPMVAIPVFSGHREAAEIYERRGTGILLEPDQMSAVSICDRLHRVLAADSPQRVAARQLAKEIARVDAATLAGERVEQYFDTLSPARGQTLQSAGPRARAASTRG